jgi:hypothetical protein
VKNNPARIRPGDVAVSPEIRERLHRLAEMMGEPDLLGGMPDWYWDRGQLGMILDGMGARAGRCRDEECRAPISWLRMKSGKWSPFSADLDPHWTTCPGAKDFRKART